MKSIDKIVTSELIIKNSKFICHLYPINSIDEIKIIIDKTKNDYKDATHNCYAYIYDEYKKASDDKEPSKTAGFPILKALEINELDHVLAIVTRYFGGIKLGANGLVRAYFDSVMQCLDKADIIYLIDGKEIEIKFTYDNLKKIDYLLKDYKIKNKKYESVITYLIEIPKDDKVIKQLEPYLLSFNVLKDILIKEKK